MINTYIPNGGQAIEAEYKPQKISEYSGNPLIEALPEIMSRDEVIRDLAVYPPYSNKERELEAHYRVHVVQRLFQCFQPLPIHLDLESRISRVIRQGYLARNPFSPAFVGSMNNQTKLIQTQNTDITSNSYFRTTAAGFTLIGFSGMGKTTAINRVLMLMPQVIVHSEYKGMSFSLYQVTWLKIECPFDSSLRGLCIEFFLKVDSILGTNYYQKYGLTKRTIDTLMSIMSSIAKSIGLGVLIIDEIQHLSEAKGGGSSRMLNFLVTLVNTISVPVILIGTTKAMSILQSEFRQARRGSGQGDMIWERMKKDSNWNLLMEALWDYQWTKNPISFTEEISNAIYDESQGIVDIAVKLYAMAQVRAILSEKEEVDVELIKSVAKENLKLVRPMLQALKSGNIKKIAKYEDIYMVDYEEFYAAEKQSIDLSNRIKEMKSRKDQKLANEKIIKKEQAVIKLLELDFKKEKVQKVVEKILKTEDENITVKDIVIKAIQLLSGAKEDNIKKKEPRINNNGNDLRVLVQEGLKDNLSAYEVLKENGYIKDFIF
jgi:hypothetical protein